MLQDEGGLHVYLLPLPREASRLTFRLDLLEAVREDGARLPLPVRLSDVSAAVVTRDRRLAA
ncbi:MAG TPA: hypothetical protein VNL37_00385, partial [Candidatus Polarisedimenticolia bacterium]|nr:hypothetical protein [Candidatus Polarisedimenticolia bacterium]